MVQQLYAPIVHSHASSWHDGGVALLTADGEIVALAAERVGSRFKHSLSSRQAYDYLRHRRAYADQFGGQGDRFVPVVDELRPEHHHRYHAASTFFAAGLDEAAVLVVDGQGQRGGRIVPTSIWRGDGSRLEIVEDLFPSDERFAAQSLGHFYTAIGALAGLTELCEEGKTMALAAYGDSSKFLTWLRERVYTEPDGRYHIDPGFIRAVLGNTFGPSLYGWGAQPDEVQALWREIAEVRGQGVRPEGAEPSQADKDVAYAGQLLLEEMLLGLAKRAHDLTGSDNLCLAGGVALNCVANERVVREGPFERVFVVPAPSDDGQALGKLMLEIKTTGVPVDTTLSNVYLGPEYGIEDIDPALKLAEGRCTPVRPPKAELVAQVASLLASGKVVGLFHGRSEWGPRALGHRSILADPRQGEMRDYINARVKDRESYRPLGPMVLEERAAEFFDLDGPSPFMTRAVQVRERARARIPAVTHVDGTARVQTVRRDQDECCYELLRAFDAVAGVPVLINTSFNGRGMPIVESPMHAVQAFLDMRIDALVLEGYLMTKGT